MVYVVCIAVGLAAGVLTDLPKDWRARLAGGVVVVACAAALVLLAEVPERPVLTGLVASAVPGIAGGAVRDLRASRRDGGYHRGPTRGVDGRG